MASWLLLVVLPLGACLCETRDAPMPPCPLSVPQKPLDISQLTGTWHLALVLLPENYSGFPEDTMCVRSELSRVNRSALLQTWMMRSLLDDYSAVMELPTTIDDAGRWNVALPLGGPVTITVTRAVPSSYATLDFCGMQHGRAVHLWTVVVSRRRRVGPFQLLQLAAKLASQGVNLDARRMVTVPSC